MRKALALMFAALASAASAREASPLPLATDYHYVTVTPSNLIHGTLRALGSTEQEDLILRLEDIAFLVEAQEERKDMAGDSPERQVLGSLSLRSESFSIPGGDTGTGTRIGYIETDIDGMVEDVIKLDNLGNDDSGYMPNSAVAAFPTNITTAFNIQWTRAPAYSASLSGALRSAALDAAYRAIAAPKMIYDAYPSVSWGAQMEVKIERGGQEHYNSTPYARTEAYTNNVDCGLGRVSTFFLSGQSLYGLTIEVWSHNETLWEVAWSDDRVCTNATQIGNGQWKGYAMTTTTYTPTNGAGIVLGRSPPFDAQTVNAATVVPMIVAWFQHYETDNDHHAAFALPGSATIEVVGDECIARLQRMEYGPFLSQGVRFSGAPELDLGYAKAHTPVPPAPPSPLGDTLPTGSEKPPTLYTVNSEYRVYSCGVYLYAMPTIFSVRPRATHPSL